MKQSLQLKLGQQLTMTPQLQQAIKLLQLSSMDLQQEIQLALDTNPMLEVNENGDPELGEENAADSDDSANSSEESLDKLASATASETGTVDTSASDDSSWDNQGDAGTPDEPTWDGGLPDELPVDSQWEDVYQGQTSSTPSSGEFGDQDYESHGSSEDSLQEHLLWQLNLTRMSERDLAIAISIIDATDENGRLTESAEEIRESFHYSLDIELDEVMAVLHRLQQFDPAGVCTHDLRECLMVQLQQLPPATPMLDQAKLVVNRYIDLLGNRDYVQLMRRSKIREAQLKEALELIQSLNPTPGQSLGADTTQYVVPDVFVVKRKGRWRVELNTDTAPRLRINSDYAGLVRRADTSADNTYLRDNLQEARWFLKSLQSRNETLMKVATKIVELQRGFLEYGEEAMKPLVLHDIASAVEMHESTISRVTTQKFMHTPRGIFELKFFFSSHVSTDIGGECSSTAIRALIKKLIAAENPRKPLSDNKITTLLEDQGIKVARRTIAKYRESLVIPPSNERKRLV